MHSMAIQGPSEKPARAPCEVPTSLTESEPEYAAREAMRRTTSHVSQRSSRIAVDRPVKRQAKSELLHLFLYRGDGSALRSPREHAVEFELVDERAPRHV